MQRLRLIFGRELRAFALSPVTWGIIALTWFAVAGAFRWSVAPAAQGFVHLMMFRLVGWINNVQMLVIPLLTMRLLAEEKRSGTFETLVTTPVRDHEIVIAKFLAVMVVVLFVWLIIPVFGLIARLSGGTPDFGPIWGTYLGIAGNGALFCAVGLMASAATRHQILAAFTGIMLCVMILWLPAVAEALPEDWFVLRGVMATGNVLRHAQDAALGMVDVVNITYQLTLSALFLFFAIRILEVRKWR